MAGDIRRIRAFLNWCWDAELIERPPRYGKEFSPPSRKVMRRKRAEVGRGDLSADDIKATLAKAPPTLRAITLLGINGAVGAKDIAAIRLPGQTS